MVYFNNMKKKYTGAEIVIESLIKSRSGNIKVNLKENKEIRLQQHKIKDQLLHLNLFLTSKKCFARLNQIVQALR